MRFLRHRPLAAASCVLALGAVAAFRMDGGTKFWLLLASAILFLAALIFFRVPSLRGVVLLCLASLVLAFGTSFLCFQKVYEPLQEDCGTSCRMTGTVTERLPSVPYRAVFNVRVREWNGESASVDLRLECDYPSAMQPGDTFTATVTPREFRTEGFDEELLRVSDGIFLAAVCRDPSDLSVTGTDRTSPLLYFRSLNFRLSARIADAVGGEAGGLSAALLLGNRSFLSEETELLFRRSGISHLLALSGLHVSILIGALEFLLRKFRIPKIARAVVVPLCAVGYLALTGFAVSTCRAVLMVCLVYLGFFLRADYDPLTALCAVLSGILLLFPYAVADLSLWMSFLAAGSILIFLPLSEKWKEALKKSRLPRPVSRRLSAFLTALSVGIAANLALVLLSAYVFGELSVLSVPATLLLSLPVTLTLISSVLVLFLPWSGFLCSVFPRLILRAAEWFSDASFAVLPATDPATRICLILLTAVLVLLALLPVRRWQWFLLPPVLCVLSMGCSSIVTALPANGACETVISEEAGIVLLSDHGFATLRCDGSVSSDDAYAAVKTARERRCTEIGELVLTSYRNQDAYYLSELCALTRVRLLRLPVPENDRERAIAARIEQEAGLHRVSVVYGE